MLNFVTRHLERSTSARSSENLDIKIGEIPSGSKIIEMLYECDDDGVSSIVGYLQAMLPVLRRNTGSHAGESNVSGSR